MAWKQGAGTQAAHAGDPGPGGGTGKCHSLREVCTGDPISAAVDVMEAAEDGSAFSVLRAREHVDVPAIALALYDLLARTPACRTAGEVLAVVHAVVEGVDTDNGKTIIQRMAESLGSP